jgi:alkanesulfonate monooxygenase SsuD/methylene tetrahydromethanopterin reductase-like flavin-dependent oxidoreductase (luciferase family)
VLGKKPTTNDNLMSFVEEFRTLTAGQPVEYDGHPIQLTWADGGVPPVWVAGYGPKVLTAAGKYADGIILQFADPHLVKWCSDFVKQGAQEAGRDPRDIRIMAAAPVWVSDDLQTAREHVRWFPALVSNHVVDLLKRHPREELPEELYTYVEDRKGYNYLHHAQVGSDNAQFVSDEIVDRYCIVGGVKEQIRRLEELQALGVDQFNIYLMVGDEEKQVATYGSKIIPHFNGKVRVTSSKKKSASSSKKKTSAKRKDK